MVQIVINGETILLDERITYNFQVGEIGEISLSKSSYTSSFELPRTAETSRIFDGLGIAGDASRTPYVINSAVLMEDYVPVLEGSLVVLSTSADFYKVTLISGAFDFFSEIGETKFSDINIDEIRHEKTLDKVDEKIRFSIFEEDYLYAFAYTGGLTHYTSDGDPVTVNIDNLVPFVRAKYLWDVIFRAFPKITFSGAFYDSYDFKNLYLSFPYPKLGDAGKAYKKLELSKRNYEFFLYPDLPPWSVEYEGAVDFLELEYPARYNLDVLATGLARVEVRRFYAEIESTPPNVPLALVVFRNGVQVPGFRVEHSDDPDSANLGSVDIYAEAGDIITFMFQAAAGLMNGVIHDLTVDISLVTADLGGGAFDLLLKDFVKEVMWRYGLVAFVKNNQIDFVSLDSLLTTNRAENWSDKYAGRAEEDYSLNFAQMNLLSHAGEDPWADREIRIDNKNIQISKTLIKSKFYPAGESLRPYRTEESTVIQATDFITFDADDKLLKRYYFARLSSDNLPYRIGSASMGGFRTYSPSPGVEGGWYVANFENLSFASNPYYGQFGRILNDTRIHKINLKLDFVDVNQLDLKKLYYFEQEQAFYKINSIRFVSGSLATGEFVKVK